MPPTTPGGCSPARKKSSVRAPTNIQSLSHDTLCVLFSYLDLLDLVRCSAVCNSWYDSLFFVIIRNSIIKKSKLLQGLYLKQMRRSGRGISSPSNDSLEESMSVYLEELAMERHRRALMGGSVVIDKWKGHSAGVDQCRMKMGMILTGVGDKVIRLWSSENLKCVEEYQIPDDVRLVDFDFDETKVVGLFGTQVCIWRRNGKRSVFPSNQGTFSKGLCMRYFDPDAVVGCEDGTARVFDMYSRQCSRIIKMHPESVSCLSLSDDQLILSGSSLGRITVSGLLSDEKIATLRPTDSTGSNLVFCGTTAGYASCWDLRKMRRLWEKRVSSNVVYSMHHLRNDTSALVVGGIDGVLRVIDQDTGESISRYVMDHESHPTSFRYPHGIGERRRGKRLPEGTHIIDGVPRSGRPPITCLAVGRDKVVTTHNGLHIRLWKFKCRRS
ncbi:F-box/WD-40 repeat-containing protein At3g52030 [Linum perenne]